MRGLLVYLNSSLSPNARTISGYSSMSVWAALSMRQRARSSLGFAKPCASENLETHWVIQVHERQRSGLLTCEMHVRLCVGLGGYSVAKGQGARTSEHRRSVSSPWDLRLVEFTLISVAKIFTSRSEWLQKFRVRTSDHQRICTR